MTFELLCQKLKLIGMWQDYAWMVKFFAAIIIGSFAISMAFTAIVILPVWFIDLLFT